MTKTTDTQLIVLSSACRRDDGMAVRPEGLKAAGAAKLAASLIAKGFVREIRAKTGVPVWREDENGRFALKILKAGREAIGVEDEAQDASDDTSVLEQRTSQQARRIGGGGERVNKAKEVGSKAHATESSTPMLKASKSVQQMTTAPRTSTAAAASPVKSKRVLVTSLLERPQGAAITDLITATGWLPHTTRAFLSGLRKGGLNITRSKGDGDSSSVYRIVVIEPAAAAA